MISKLTEKYLSNIIKDENNAGKRMVNYRDGKIYCVRNYMDGEVYVGSTTQPLSKRMGQHRRKSKTHDSLQLYQHIRDYGAENFYIELFESFPCDNNEQLRKREGEVIRGVGTLNKRIEGRTMKEWYEDNKQRMKEYGKVYREKNKDELMQYHKQYYEANRDKLNEASRENSKEHYKANRERYQELHKRYYEDNKEKMREKHREYSKAHSEKYKEKVECEVCGVLVSRQCMKRHQRSKKCILHATQNLPQ
jgi:hypothetical protein